jgi:tetratricopeptide (TPR) repeat protein
MEEFLQTAQTLLQQMVDSRDAPTMVVARRLRDLAIVLDKLHLSAECILVGNCALSLVGAIAPWSLGHQLEYAETIALIARLSPYQPHARTLFLQAVTLCEEVTTKDGCQLNKKAFLRILDRAGRWSVEHPDLAVQWLGQAIRMMTTEPPSTMVNDYIRGRIYVHYGSSLSRLGRLSEAMDAGQKAVSLARALSAVKGKEVLFRALGNLGNTFRELHKYEDSAAAFEEALELDRSFISQDPESIYEHTKALVNYASTLVLIKKVSEAAELHQEAVTRRRELVRMDETYTVELCKALKAYGKDCYLLGRHPEAILAFEECISLTRGLTDGSSTRPQTALISSLHYFGNSLNVLGRKSDAEAAASEFLQRNGGKPHATCNTVIRRRKCFVCGKIPVPDRGVLGRSGLDQYEPSSTLLRVN